MTGAGCGGSRWLPEENPRRAVLTAQSLTPGKCVYVKAYREFDSHPIRE